MSITTSDAPPRQINDTPLRVVLEGRRGRSYDEALATACRSHGRRLGRAGAALPEWLPTAPRWARDAMAGGRQEILGPEA